MNLVNKELFHETSCPKVAPRIVLQLCWLPAHTHTRVAHILTSETRKLKSSYLKFSSILLMLKWNWMEQTSGLAGRKGSNGVKCLLTWTTWTLLNFLYLGFPQHSICLSHRSSTYKLTNTNSGTLPCTILDEFLETSKWPLFLAPPLVSEHC